MPINFLLVALSSGFLNLVFLVLLKRFALRTGLLIQRGIPLVGGLSMGLAFGLTCLFSAWLCGNLNRTITGVIFTSAIMLFFGIIDDWRELSILAKFFVQIVATSLLILFGIRTNIVYIGNLLNIIITFLWVLGIANAFNHLDIIDGLAAGVATIVSFSFFIISVLNKDFSTALLALIFGSVTFSFLFYNFPPARVFMGNSGSHFLGFVLAATALVISYAPLNRKIALLSPLLILGLPIFDTAFLVLIRMIKNNLPFKKSNDHLALRFLALGYSKKKALWAMLVLSLFFAFCGISLSQVSNAIGIAITILVVLVSLFVMRKMAKVAIYD